MATTKTPVSGVVSDFDPGATRPYAFVPPRPEEALRDAPILHHGANAGQTELLSGELLCDLTALTPLLVGNDQYLVGSAKPGTLDCAWTLDLEKNIIEPLRLEDGRVAIAPESLKGMIRHNLGALLGAPMERVAEHYFSFRPNLDHPQDKKNPRTLPAVVVDPQKREVLVLPDLKDFALVVDDGQVGAKLAFGSTVPKDARYIFDEGGVCMKVARYGKGRRSFDGWIKCRYRHGVDGEGRLASLFAGRAPTKARYGCALVDNAALMDGDARRASTPIPEAVWNHYLATRVELTDSPGLLTDTHILLKKKAGEPRATHDALKRSERLEKHQLIFVEIDDRGDIVSFGHDFRYRWAYFDSVRARFRAYEKH